MTTPAPLGNPRLDAALSYLHRGWVPIPINGKKPFIEWDKYQSTKPTDKEIRQWWARWPEANIGLVTGAISGLVVVDLDGPAGQEAFTATCGGELPATVLASTGRGLHAYFRHPGRKVRNRAGVLSKVDIRGDGGFVVAPGSRHPNGQDYEWKASPDELNKALDPPMLGIVRAVHPAQPSRR